MTFRTPILAAVLALAAVPALAQTTPVAPPIPDVDANGTWSIDEMLAVFPTLTPETFASLDGDANAELDQAEVAAAVEAGVLVMG